MAFKKKQRSAEDDLRQDIASFAADPYSFVLYSYPWGEGELKESKGPREWQKSILNDIGYHLKSENRFIPLQIAVSSGHGIGKSTLVAWIIHWALSTCEDCRVKVTANTGDQLMTKTAPESYKWLRMAINSHWWQVSAESIKARDDMHEKTWRADFETWSLERTESFAGLHNRGKRIVLIFDEASAIPDKIWEVAEGALTDEDTEIIWVVFGNPTMNTGRFRECFGSLRHRWITRQIDSRSVPGTNNVQLERWIQDYGEDSDFCRVRVKGEFPRAGTSQFIPSDVVFGARKRDAGDQSKAHKIISVDVARFGDDQTVIGERQGLRYRVIERLRGVDTMQTAMRTAKYMREIEPRLVVVDGDGVGGGVVDWLNLHMRDWMDRRKWFRLVEFHGANTPGDKFMYANKRAEVWGRMKDWLATGQIPDEPELAAELSGPEYKFNSKNQIQLEPKEDMKKRGLASPDTGDNLAMTFAVSPTVKTRDEEFEERVQKVAKVDPMEAHFLRLGETERRKKQKEPLMFWM
jgi:hypothetical protein